MVRVVVGNRLGCNHDGYGRNHNCQYVDLRDSFVEFAYSMSDGDTSLFHAIMNWLMDAVRQGRTTEQAKMEVNEVFSST